MGKVINGFCESSSRWAYLEDGKPCDMNSETRVSRYSTPGISNQHLMHSLNNGIYRGVWYNAWKFQSRKTISNHNVLLEHFLWQRYVLILNSMSLCVKRWIECIVSVWCIGNFAKPIEILFLVGIYAKSLNSGRLFDENYITPRNSALSYNKCFTKDAFIFTGPNLFLR